MNLHMADTLKQTSRWSIGGFITGALGFGLGFTVHPLFLLLSAAACFVLPLLRLLGVLHDQDEFKIHASKHAALISYLMSGLFIMSIVITGRMEVITWQTDMIIMNLLPLLLMSYYLAYFFQFWNGRAAARIITYILLLFWGAFTILSAIGSEEGFTGFIMQFSVTLIPLIAALAAAKKSTLFSGILMLAAALFHLIFFNAYREMTVAVLLPIPELVIGLGYLKEYRQQKLELPE